MSPSSGSPADLEKSEREKQRMREQERRRREAVSRYKVRISKI